MSSAIRHADANKSNGHDSGPGFFQKVANTPAFERVRDEAGNIGDAVVQEISKTAKTVVLTGADHFAAKLHRGSSAERAEDAATSRGAIRGSAYQPSLERNPS